MKNVVTPKNTLAFSSTQAALGLVGVMYLAMKMDANDNIIIRQSKWKVMGYMVRFWSDRKAISVATAKQKAITSIGKSRLFCCN
ncbi:hypothetical protein Vadar_008857 [Vaccinium darrowii]|nr:hypothetical protein Vadar_008857 [Vaccinium darrowii]